MTYATEQPSDCHSNDLSFDIDTIRGFINTNLELENVDEDFYLAIARAYQTNPRLFAEMIEDLNADNIKYLAEGIAYAVAKSLPINLL